MIKLYARMLPAAVRGWRGAPMLPTEALASRFRVLPHDIDLNAHLNNGRYLQLMDVNRGEWLLRTRIAAAIRRHRWRPILGSTAIQFRRELKLWDTGVVSTRLAAFDARWVYLEHAVHGADGRPVALGLARAGFRARGGWVPIDTVRAALPYVVPDLAMPAHIAAWVALDGALGGRIAQR